MNEQHAQNGTASVLCPAAVAKFLSIFRMHDAKSRSSWLKKALHWFRERHCFKSSIQDPESRQLSVKSTGLSVVAVKKFQMKALAGRGRKRATWVDYIDNILLIDF